MERRLVLDVVVAHRAAVLELFVLCEYEALLIRRDAEIVLNFALDVVDGIRCLDVERRVLPEEFHDDLHRLREGATPGAVSMPFWMLQSLNERPSSIASLRENEALLIGRDALWHGRGWGIKWQRVYRYK